MQNLGGKQSELRGIENREWFLTSQYTPESYQLLKFQPLAHYEMPDTSGHLILNCSSFEKNMVFTELWPLHIKLTGSRVCYNVTNNQRDPD